MKKQISRFFLLLFSLSMFYTAFGQGSKPGYTGSFESAALRGAYETNIVITTAHGINYKKWSMLIGAGIDYYRSRSVPIYVDVRKYLLTGKQQLFLQAAAGINIAWPTSEQKISAPRWNIWWPNRDTFSFSNGLHTKTALGIVFNPKDRIKVNLNLGWSYKSHSTRNHELVYNGTSNEYVPRTTIYGMHRLHIGLGVGL